MKTLSKGLSLLLLPGILWLFFNATVNRHPHVGPDGHFFYHAHPYDKTTSGPLFPESHRHSEGELFFLNFISDPAAPFLFFTALTTILYAIPCLTGIFQRHAEPAREYYRVFHYHAPPVF